MAWETENNVHWPENIQISIKISLEFLLKGGINNIPALVWIMAWRQPGNKPLSEPLMANLLTHICVTLGIFLPWPSSSQNGSVYLSVCSFSLSVCLSVTPHYFQYYHWQKWCASKRQGQRSNIKDAEVKINFAWIWEFPQCNFYLNLYMVTKLCTKIDVA